MNRELAKKVADAVLYEGYMLYPYRPSAIKNRQRWSFGILYPPAYEEVRTGTERASMHSECVVVSHASATLDVQLRFLQLHARQLQELQGESLTPVQSLLVNGKPVESWDEAIERSVEVRTEISTQAAARAEFQFRATHSSEPIRDAAGVLLGTIERVQHEIAGELMMVCEKIGPEAIKIAIDISNHSALPSSATTRDYTLLSSLLSAHLILTVDSGEFVSLLDPPDEFRTAVNACNNVVNFPVLVGNEGERDMMLCSPILLYDYPQIAPESAGDFFDATEMDEMLTLRVITLTDDEKDEMRADPHAHNLLERTEQTVREQLQRTHGAIRSMRPVSDRHD